MISRDYGSYVITDRGIRLYDTPDGMGVIPSNYKVRKPQIRIREHGK